MGNIGPTSEGPKEPSSPEKRSVMPKPGEIITSLVTQSSYTMGELIGEGAYGLVFACRDVWENDLAAKVLKPVGSYDRVKAMAQAEFGKLLHVRSPYITFVYDAFEYRDTFYIVTERCYCPLTKLFSMENFVGTGWLVPIARCLLQAVHYLHLNGLVHQDIHAGNVFALYARDELARVLDPAVQFKLGDLGVAKVLAEVNAENTRAQWMLPPEVLDGRQFGPVDWHVDVYHTGLLLLQLAYSKEMQFSQEDILTGRPREMASALSAPYGTALEKALRRHVAFRTAGAMELWRDLRIPDEAAASGGEAGGHSG